MVTRAEVEAEVSNLWGRVVTEKGRFDITVDYIMRLVCETRREAINNAYDAAYVTDAPREVLNAIKP